MQGGVEEAIRLIVKVPMGTLLQDTEPALMREFVSLKSARETTILPTAEVQLFQRTCDEYLRNSRGSDLPQKLANPQKALLTRLRIWHAAFAALGSQEERYGMAMSAAQGTTNSTTPELTDAYHLRMRPSERQLPGNAALGPLDSVAARYGRAP
ncbi:hypothetical protein MAP00_007635 [Monascus purpureus]|nr:hypothetical protein MAP00_007635 [Monascus purpureus]